LNKKNIKYYCLTQKGEKKLPNQKEITEFHQSGIEPEIFLDSNVCLHIIKIVDYPKNPIGVNKERLIVLKEYISKHNIRINALFGLMELSYSKNIFDKDKFQDFKNRIDFFIQIPLKHFKKFNYNYLRDYQIFSQPKLKDNTTFFGLESFILSTYCVLLKIREISLSGLTKKDAKKNIFKLLDWMINDLKFMLGVEYKLGMNIFGGKTEFRKMIWLEGKQNLTQKKIMGSAWDITHSRFITNNEFLNKIVDKNIYVYYLTSDRHFYELISKYSITAIFKTKAGTTTMHNTNFDYPHFETEFIDEQNNKMIEIMGDRINKEPMYDRERILRLIDNLEKSNNIA